MEAGHGCVQLQRKPTKANGRNINNENIEEKMVFMLGNVYEKFVHLKNNTTIRDNINQKLCLPPKKNRFPSM